MSGEGGDTLRVRRLDCRYVVPPAEPRRAAVRERLDRAAASALGDALGSCLAPLARDGGDGVWLLRRLDVDLDLDVDLPPADLARRWAAAIAARLGRALSEGDGVVYFSGEAEYLGSFLVDRAGGRARGRWYYRMFAGFDAMPASLAIRAAIVERPALARRALALLAPAQRAAVAAAMSEVDAERAGVAIASAAPGDEQGERVVAVLVRALRLAVRDPRLAASPAAAAVAVVAAGAADDVAIAWPLARAATELSAVLRAAPARVREALSAAIERGSAEALRLVDASVAGRLAPLWTVPRSARAAIASAAVTAIGDAEPERVADAPAPLARYTPFGGLLMLLPMLEEAGDAIEALAAGLCGADTADNAALVRLLVVAKVAGTDRAAAVAGDPVWRDVLGVRRQLTAAAIRELLAASPPIERRGETLLSDEDAAYLALPPALCARADVDRVLSRISRRSLSAFDRRLPGFAGSSARYLFASFLDAGATVTDTGEATVAVIERPPIHVVLAMTSLMSAEMVPSWRETPIRLTEGPR